MALYRVDTSFFEAVNCEDPDVALVEGAGRGNRWIPRADAASVGKDATVVRVRALTRPEVDSCPLDNDAAYLARMVEQGVHEADKGLVASLAWQYQRTLGAVISEVSTRPLGSAKPH